MKLACAFGPQLPAAKLLPLKRNWNTATEFAWRFLDHPQLEFICPAQQLPGVRYIHCISDECVSLAIAC